MLKGKFTEAETAFKEAQTNLGKVGEVNQKILENDINVGLIIATVPAAREDFIKKMGLNKTNTSTTNSNTNSSTVNSSTENKPKAEGVEGVN